MSALRYSATLSPRSLDAFDSAAHAQWSRIEFAAPVTQLGHLWIRTHVVRIQGDADLLISAATSDVIAKLEVFRLRLQLDREARYDHRFPRPTYEDSGDLLSAFLGKAHQVFIATRRHVVPEWARHSVLDLIAEDLLILRDPSGQQAFISPDDGAPGTLSVTRTRDNVSASDLEIVSLRIL
jgi:hypothetical protein